jgi:uncharacterized protein (DUF58 family)
MRERPGRFRARFALALLAGLVVLGTFVAPASPWIASPWISWGVGVGLLAAFAMICRRWLKAARALEEVRHKGLRRRRWVSAKIEPESPPGNDQVVSQVARPPETPDG